jgi:hypothetical protein
MKMLVAAATFGLLLAMPAAAQDTPAPATPPAATPPSASTAPATDHDVLEQCKEAALAKGLPEEERRREVAACVIAATPKIATRIRCLMDPKLKTLDKDARNAAVLACIEGK